MTPDRRPFPIPFVWRTNLSCLVALQAMRPKGCFRRLGEFELRNVHLSRDGIVRAAPSGCGASVNDFAVGMLGSELPYEADLRPGSPVVGLLGVAIALLVREGELRAEAPYR